MQTTLSGNKERKIFMKRVLEMLKNDLVNVNWSSELDALSTVHGLKDVQVGKSTYHCMRNTSFELYVRREKVLGEEYIRVKVTDYDNLEERNFKISTNLFDKFITALETFAKETEKDRMMKRYFWAVEEAIQKEVDKRLAAMKKTDPED